MHMAVSDFLCEREKEREGERICERDREKWRQSVCVFVGREIWVLTHMNMLIRHKRGMNNICIHIQELASLRGINRDQRADTYEHSHVT